MTCLVHAFARIILKGAILFVIVPAVKMRYLWALPSGNGRVGEEDGHFQNFSLFKKKRLKSTTVQVNRHLRVHI